MAETLTQRAKFGDSDDTLIAKAAYAAQVSSGLIPSTNIDEQTPQIGQTNSNLLRLAHAIDVINGATTGLAAFGDTDSTLFYKAAKGMQLIASVVNSTNIEVQTPQSWQSYENLLRLAYAAQLNAGISSGIAAFGDTQNTLLIKLAIALQP